MGEEIKFMKILLVEPHLGIKRTWLYRFIFYRSLALEQIAALTPDIHSVDIIDEKFKNIDFTKHYDLVGISCLTCNAIRGYEISDEFRSRGIPVVLGGYHPTALPEEAKMHADSVVIGEAELIWPQLLKDLENKELKPFYKADRFVEGKLIPPAKRSKDNISYNASIQASRGCPTRCKFCAMHFVEGSIFRPRPINIVIEEIKSIKQKNLFFVDASLTINPKNSKNLFKEMIGLNKKFECFGNINVLAKDNELLKLASDAGCTRWLVGIESIFQKNIDDMGKRTNKVKRYEASIRNIKDHGMMVTGLFMFGFDNDIVGIFDSTLEAMYKWDLDNAAFSIVTPYPGTYLFNQLKNEGRIISYDWSRYTEGNVNFIPKNMSPEELLQGIINMNKEYYSYASSMKRCLGSKNLSLSLFINKLWRNLFSTKLFNKELFNY